MVCTVVEAVVKDNSQTNENGQILTSHCPDILNVFWRHLEHIIMTWTWPHMQIHVVLQQRGWSGRTCDVS